jgi:iron complex outermembrane receptor protein
VVVGEGVYLPEAVFATPSAQDRLLAVDGASLLREIPGAAVVRNGPLTGMVQLRGLSGDRVNVQVNGMTITPACPNHMDPPLHYAAPGSVGSLTALAGVTPVSMGGDSIAGTVRADPPAPRFSTNEQTLFFGEAGGVFRSANDGWGAEARAGAATRSFSAAYTGSWQTGEDLRFPGGRVRDTGYETQQHDVSCTARTEKGLWAFGGSRTLTRDAGTPALPMDMIQDDSYSVAARHAGSYSFGTLEARGFFHAIDHLMDNYSLRPVAPGAMRMFSPAESDDYGVSLDLSLPRAKHTFRVGTGFHRNEFDAHQQNLMTGLRQDTLNEAERTRVGTYLEWQAEWTERWTTLFGVRNDTILSDAADIAQSFLASAADRAAFNSRDHDFLDADFDATGAVRFTPGEHASLEFALARKTRAPSLLERYLWTPLSASAGQADGRTYLGNLGLDPEVSHQAAATLDLHGERWQVKVTPFYNYVTDYIQGAPIARTNAGLPVLQFQNLDRVHLYGVEGSAAFTLSRHFAVRGTISYVRGINLENDDNLYRIAPLHGMIGLEHQWKALRNNLEVVLADSQQDVARYNSEPPTGGYALLNLRTACTLFKRLTLELALDNLFDERYADHLGGINRVSGSDVPVGSRIPGAGRAVSASLHVRL